MSFGGPSAALGTVAQKFLMEDAQKHQIKILRNQKQWLYDDLRAAGINPILAGNASQVAGGAGAPSVNPGSDQTGAEIRNMGLFRQQLNKAKADASNARNLADITGSQKVIEQARADYYNSARGKAELKGRFSDENTYGPFQGLGWAGVGAGAASGLGGAAAQVDKEPAWEWFDKAVGKGLNTGRDLFESIKEMKREFGPGVQEFYDERVGPYWKNKRKWNKKRGNR